MMVKREDLEFIIFCVENVAKRLGKSGSEIYDILSNKTNILVNYIAANSEVLHTQGKDYIINDIIGVMQNEGLKV